MIRIEKVLKQIVHFDQFTSFSHNFFFLTLPPAITASTIDGGCSTPALEYILAYCIRNQVFFRNNINNINLHFVSGGHAVSHLKKIFRSDRIARASVHDEQQYEQSIAK